MTELCKSCARQNFCGNNITKYYCTGYMPYVETRWEADDIKVPPFTDGQKKLIEATEKLANGKLICDVDDDIDEFPKIYAEPQPSKDFLPINCYVCNASGWIAGNGHRHTSKCKRCNGTGKINYYTLTNEDFLRTATTEELAEWIASVVKKAISIKENNGIVMLESVIWWVEWLKQPHTNS